MDTGERKQEPRSERMEKAPVEGETPDVTMRSATMEVHRHDVVEGPVTWEEMRAMLRGEPVGALMQTWRPTTGGILAILAGSWNLIIGGAAIFGTTFFFDLLGDIAIGSVAGIGAGIVWAVLGIIAIIGGSLAIARSMWWIALAGAIAAAFPSPLVIPTLMGVLALIFIPLGKREFES